MAKNYYDGMKGSPADAWSAESTKRFSDKYEKAKKEEIVAPSEVVSSLSEATLEAEADWRRTDGAERVAKANKKTQNFYDGMKGSPADAWSAESTKRFSDKYEKDKKRKIVAPSEVVSSLFEATLEAEAEWRHTDGAERVAKANAKTEDFYNGMKGSPADAWSPENTQRFSDEYEKAKKEEIVAPSEVVSSLFESSLEAEAEWRRTDGAERVEQANKKALIEEKKEQFKKDASLLKDMENNKKENNQGKAYWRTGSPSHPEQLGDFNRARIMTGPYNNQKEATYLTMSFASQMNEKTQEMYNRYFEAKKDPKGLDSDPTVKQWVKDGDEKATAVIKQHSAEISQSNGTRYDDRAHQMALNNQRGR